MERRRALAADFAAVDADGRLADAAARNGIGGPRSAQQTAALTATTRPTSR